MSIQNTASLSEWFEQQLEKRASRGLQRQAVLVATPAEFHFGSNDYLALSRHPQVCAALSQAERVGACASRLVSGTSAAHDELEDALARLCEMEASIVFGSGYHANVGLLTAVCRRQDTVISDRLLHASMQDGIVLSGAKHLRYSHNDVVDLRARLETAQAQREPGSDSRIFVLTESLFSINGDIAPLQEIVSLCKEFGASLIVDEAHAIGVYGQMGGGIVSALGLSRDVFALTGSFSKAIGTFGGFVATSALARRYLIGASRSFIYSTALPPALAEATVQSLALCESGRTMAFELFDIVQFFVDELFRCGLIPVPLDVTKEPELRNTPRCTYIFPFLCSGAEQVVALSSRLKDQGIFAYPMRAPTVPRGTECVRFSITRWHTQESLRRTVECLARAVEGS